MLSLSFFLLMLIPSSLMAYPIFFKCDAQGRLEESLSPSEWEDLLAQMAQSLQKLNPQQKEKTIEAYCSGAALCMSEFKMLLSMAESSGKVTEQMMKTEIDRIQKKSQERVKRLQGQSPISNETFLSLSKYRSLLENTALAQECRIAMSSFDPEKLNVDGKCILGNFHHSPYMYPSGVRDAGKGFPVQKSPPPTCSAIKDLVQGAMAMDQDPYATIALSLMENGTEVEGLYLDPIGVVQTLGCSSERGSRSQHNMISFGTYHNVNFKTVSNPHLESQIKDYVRLKGTPTTSSPSYVCSAASKITAGESDCEESGEYILRCKKPLKGSCCLGLSFSIMDKSSDSLTKAVTLASLDKYLQGPLNDDIKGSDPQDYPARRLQRFNGYTDSMGGAESVSPWRSGVDYYRTPAYGYQALDFILNTLWSNPYVRAAVASAEKSLGRRSRSILCQGSPAGSYFIEHDHYFNKHAQAPRMKSILGRWEKDPHWGALSQRDRNVMSGEMMAVCLKEADFCKDFDTSNPKKLKEALKNPRREQESTLTQMMKTYIKEYYPLRRTIAQANRMDQGFEWTSMDSDQFQSFLKSFSTNLRNGK